MSISPNVPSPEESYRYESTGTPRWIAVLFGVVIAGLAVLGYASYSTQTRMSTDLAKQQEQNKILTAQLDQANSRIADLKSQMELTTQRVGLTQSELARAKSRAEAIRQDQQASDQKLTAQLGQVQKENEEKIGAVATEVGGAKKDIEATKGKLERSLGDMNVMSGLIAHSRDDLEDLKRRGDRNYYEFTLQRSKTAQRVGPVQMSLNKTDPKKAKYTITVVADDKTIEKKDKTSGEPVQFYVKVSTRKAAYEIVVFEVGKSQINGYLATPKEGGAAAAPSAAPAAATPAATPTKP